MQGEYSGEEGQTQVAEHASFLAGAETALTTTLAPREGLLRDAKATPRLALHKGKPASLEAYLLDEGRNSLRIVAGGHVFNPLGEEVG